MVGLCYVVGSVPNKKSKMTCAVVTPITCWIALLSVIRGNVICQEFTHYALLNVLDGERF